MAVCEGTSSERVTAGLDGELLGAAPEVSGDRGGQGGGGDRGGRGARGLTGPWMATRDGRHRQSKGGVKRGGELLLWP